MNNDSRTIYQIVGGALPRNASTYIEREADKKLCEFARAMQEVNRVFCIFAPRQWGKSSLMVRIAHQLTNEGLICVQLNLQGLGGVDSEHSLLYNILEHICLELDKIQENTADLKLAEKLDKVWNENPHRLPTRRFQKFLVEEILGNFGNKKLIIFIDEIQNLILWQLQDYFIGFIRELVDNQTNACLQRLNFVLLGVTKPSDLSSNPSLVLNLGQQIDLGKLKGNCEPLWAGLKRVTSEPNTILEIILDWTGGQPFLTQLICDLVANHLSPNMESRLLRNEIEKIIHDHVILNWAIQDRQSHFKDIEKRFVCYGNEEVKRQEKCHSLELYQQILQGNRVLFQIDNNEQWDLLISGLVAKDEQGKLSSANRIYEEVFNSEWIDSIQQQLNSPNLEHQSNQGLSTTLEQGMTRTIYDELVDRGLSVLRIGLLQFIKREMERVYGSHWQENLEVQTILKRPGRSPEDTHHLDNSVLLSFICNKKIWSDVFSQTLTYEHRDLGFKLRETRNYAKHDKQFSNDDAYRALDRIVLLLKAVAPERVADVEQMKLIVLRVRFDKQSNSSQLTREQSSYMQPLESIIQREIQPLEERSLLPNPLLSNPNPMERYPLMSRAKKIENIIQQRRPLVDQINSVEDNLNTLADRLDALETLRLDLIRQMKDPKICDRLQTLELYPLLFKVSRERDNLHKLGKRLSRHTLNIGVVGLMGQGKSTFLQSISGLSNDVIPALKGQACTAVRSTICHQEGETYAEVTVHSEDSFLKEVIAPYYQELGLGSAPKTLNNFAKMLPNFSGIDATLESMYEHLKGDYHDNLQQYCYLLEAGSPRKLPPIPKAQIEQYVSQRRNNQGELITFVHLAVREVTIYCPFPNQDVGKIALVDVPGLGDTRLGDEQLILQTLGQEVDLVLFIRRPDPLRFGWEKRDTDLYKTAYQALNNLENRAFMILNQVSGNDNNLEACQKHQATLGDKHLNVVRCEIADCANRDRANQILDLVLDYLADRISALDDQYTRTYQDSLLQLQRDVSAELNKVRQVWSDSSLLEDANDDEKFVRLFNKLWLRLARGLEELLEDLNPNRDDNEQEDDIFQQAISKVIEKCKEDTGIPTLDQIIDRFYVEGDWPTTYAKFLHEIRNHLTENFRSMDNGLQEYVEQAKYRVSDILAEQGNLKGLTQVRGSEFLQFIASQVPDRFKKLKQAFQTLSDFEMSYKVNFQYRIRPHLDNLNPNRTNLQLSQSPKSEPKEVKAKEILNYLEVLQEEALYKCQNALDNFYCEPKQAAFAEVEGFVDQVLRAEDVKDQWRIFLSQEKAKIWKSEFGSDEEGNDQQKWQSLAEQVSAANQLKLMQFLN